MKNSFASAIILPIYQLRELFSELLVHKDTSNIFYIRNLDNLADKNSVLTGHWLFKTTIISSLQQLLFFKMPQARAKSGINIVFVTRMNSRTFVLSELSGN